ncbi:MAG: hypothetical protein IJA65_05435, partial [Acholeplasmatales bacterium]|nr:hypothetical protein [Acholeplasmatales bacterium]
MGKLLSANILKIIACISMAIDHIGLILFPEYEIFRILGRIAFPIFAFFIAEGCYYTKNKTKYLLTILSMGLIYFLINYFYDKSIYGNIFLTFSISILVIYLLQILKIWIFNNTKIYKYIISLLTIIIIFIGIYYIFELIVFEYDYIGMLIPVIISLVDFKKYNTNTLKYLDNYPTKLLLLTIGLIILSISGRM